MHHAHRITVAVVVAAALTAGVASPALAKGPVPVAIEGPGMGGPLDLTEVGDWDLIGELIHASGLYNGVGQPIAAPSADKLGPAYTLIWRSPTGPGTADAVFVQHIHSHADHGLVIHTPPQTELDLWHLDTALWAIAAPSLPAVLTSLGVKVLAASPPPLTGEGTAQRAPLVDLDAHAVTATPSADASGLSLRAHPLVLATAGAALIATALAITTSLRGRRCRLRGARGKESRWAPVRGVRG